MFLKDVIHFVFCIFFFFHILLHANVTTFTIIVYRASIFGSLCTHKYFLLNFYQHTFAPFFHPNRDCIFFSLIHTKTSKLEELFIRNATSAHSYKIIWKERKENRNKSINYSQKYNDASNTLKWGKEVNWNEKTVARFH